MTGSARRNQTLGVVEGWETVGSGWDCPSGGSFFWVGGGDVSSIALWISSLTSRVAFLNSLMPVPRPLASSGSFFAPNKIKTTARIRTISQPPRNAANIVFINLPSWTETKPGGAPSKAPKSPVGVHALACSRADSLKAGLQRLLGTQHDKFPAAIPRMGSLAVAEINLPVLAVGDGRDLHPIRTHDNQR